MVVGAGEHVSKRRLAASGGLQLSEEIVGQFSKIFDILSEKKEVIRRDQPPLHGRIGSEPLFDLFDKYIATPNPQPVNRSAFLDGAHHMALSHALSLVLGPLMESSARAICEQLRLAIDEPRLQSSQPAFLFRSSIDLIFWAG